MGEQRTVEDVKRDLKNKLRPFLNSLRKLARQDPNFLDEFVRPPAFEEQPAVLADMAAKGHSLTITQLAELHELTSSVLISLLREDDGEGRNK